MRSTAPSRHRAFACRFTLSTDRELKIRRKDLSLGGTELKFVTGPRIANEHVENRAQKDVLMAEPENRLPPLQARP